MNAITTLPPSGGGLMPSNLRDAMDLASMMAKGRLVPKDLQGSAADCLMVIEQAMRWQMSPFAVCQEVSVIQGKMMFSGKIVAAAIHTSGVLEGRLSYEYSGEGSDLAVTASGLLRGEAAARTVSVRLAEAKTNNQHWAKSPKQMLSYHAARVWARRHAPEVMLGVYAPEEFDEPRHVQSSVVQEPRPAPPSLGQKGLTKKDMDEAVKGDTISPWRLIGRDGDIKDAGDAQAWAKQWFIRVNAVRDAKSYDGARKAETLRQMHEANVSTFEALDQAGHSAVVTDVIQLIADAIADFTAPPEPAEPEDEFLEAAE
jgi:hypothetical protein